jgi:hypothetical protein
MRKSNQKKVERLMQLWVVVEKKDLPTLRKMVSEFGAMLGQEVMYFEVAKTEVEFLEPAESKESTDD